MPLSTLANELVLLIGGSLSNAQHIFSLLRVNKRFASLLTPHFYTVATHVRLHITDRTQSRTRETVLHWASRKGFERPVEELLKRGASMTERRPDGSTPLYLAAQAGHEGVVRLLVSQGPASTEAMRIATNDGKTALYIAAVYGHDRVVKLLLESGFSTAAQANGGITPLEVAVKGGHEIAVSMLLDYGAKTNIMGASENRTNGSILHWIARYYCSVMLLRDYDLKPILKLLLAHGANVMALDSYRRTPLHFAAKNGVYMTAGLFMGKDVSKKLSVARVAHREMVALLLQSGADVNVKDLGGRTPLHDAAQSLDVCTVEELLAAGAGVDVRNNDWKTALQLALPFESRAQGKKVIELLQNRQL